MRLLRRADHEKAEDGTYQLPANAVMEWVVPVTLREVVAWVNDKFQEAADGEVW